MRLLTILFIFCASFVFAQNNVPLYGPASATGTNTYVLAYKPTPVLSDGLKILVNFTNASTGASTLNVDGTGAIELLDADGTAITNGDIAANSHRWVVYRASKWRLVSAGSSGGGGSSDWNDLTSVPDAIVDLETMGTAGQIPRVNVGADGYEFFTPFTSPATTDEDIIKYNGTAYERVGIGADGEVLRVASGVLGYGAVDLADTDATTNQLPVAKGGTGTATPGLVAGDGIEITGTWPNQTVTNTGEGGGGSGSRILLFFEGTKQDINVAGETIMTSFSFLIPGNTLQVGDLVVWSMLVTRAGTTSTCTLQTSVNTSLSITGDAVTAIEAIAAAQKWIPLTRHWSVESLTSVIVFNNAANNIASDIGVISNSAHTTITNDFASDQYFITSMNPNNTTDIFTVRWLMAEIIR